VTDSELFERDNEKREEAELQQCIAVQAYANRYNINDLQKSWIHLVENTELREEW
jgi:hypothetical protein